MKRFHALFMTLLLVLAFVTTAFAAPDYWAHPKYNLSKVTTLNIIEIEERNDSDADNFYPDENSVDMVKSALYQAAGKYKLNLTEFALELPEPTAEAKLVDSAQVVPSEVNLKIIINNIGYLKTVDPAHYETVQRTVTRTITKSDGSVTTISEPITEQQYVPQKNYYFGKSDIIYQLYDVKTNVMIFNSRDNRLRDFTYDPTSMVERSARDFLKNMQKTK